jgi:hypothetical protein
MRWTKKHDYGIAFGAALGMSASQISEYFDVTRCAVIGRADRCGIELDEDRGKRNRRNNSIRALGGLVKRLGLTPNEIRQLAAAKAKAA